MNISDEYLRYAHTEHIIDLHELPVSEVVDTLHRALYYHAVHKSDIVRIVHGIGAGVLQDMVMQELRKNPLIQAYSLDTHGGSTTVRIYPHPHTLDST